MENICQICSAFAQYVNYSVLSCSSCKIFFRRNGNRDEKYFKCKFNNQCEINIDTRHRCPPCRLKKCLQLGMSTDLFRASRTKKIYQTQQLSRINILSFNESSLTDDQWMLIKNLVTCYQESEFILYGQQLVALYENYSLTDNMFRKYVDQFLQLLYRNTGMCIGSNDDFRHLPSDERSIRVYNAVENISCLTGVFAIHHCQLYKLKIFRQIMEDKYGARTVDIHLWSGKYFNSNIFLTKLAVSLYAFSENLSDDSIHSIEMFEIQNKYAEVTWRYLIYRYGYDQAVQQFLNIILCLCSINVLRFHARNLVLHLNDVDNVTEQMELNFILDDVEQVISND